MRLGSDGATNFKVRSAQFLLDIRWLIPVPPKHVVAKVCIPNEERGEICATACQPLEGTGRAWRDCRVRARRLAEAAPDGEQDVAIYDRCETNVVVQHGRETLLCADCRSEPREDRDRERAVEAERERQRAVLAGSDPETARHGMANPVPRVFVISSE